VRAAGNHIVCQTSLVRDGELLPIVLQHAQLVASLARLLRTLGLRAVPAEPASLKYYLAQREHAGS
jgi:hypothetical protein